MAFFLLLYFTLQLSGNTYLLLQLSLNRSLKQLFSTFLAILFFILAYLRKVKKIKLSLGILMHNFLKSYKKDQSQLLKIQNKI